MRFGRVAVALCHVVSLQTSVASAQTPSLTLSDVLMRAREHAPDLISARLSLDEIRGRLVGASLRRQANPELEAAAGSRHGSGVRSLELDVGLTQMLEPGARRAARIAGATAAIGQRTADIEEATREVLRVAAAAYYRALHASTRIALLDASQAIAAGVYAAADRRYKAGDIAVLDVHLARAAWARARAERDRAEAARVMALGDLKQLLRIDGDIAVNGDLATPRAADLAALVHSAADRPELRALEAGLREADAAAALGRSFLRPDYGITARYERDEGDHRLLGGMTLTLPVFSNGQELRATGSARAARLRSELARATTRVHVEVRTAYDAYQRRVAAVTTLQDEALPGLDESDALSARSFDVGQLALPELLLIRREILETRFAYLDALLETNLARVDLDASAGVLR